MREDIMRKLITMICDDYIEALLTGIEEYEKIFPILLLVLIILVN